MMKKSILFIVIAICFCTLIGCRDNDDELDIDYDYIVTYDATGGKMGNYDKRYLYVKDNSLIAEPGTSNLVNAVQNGYTLQGWCKGILNEDGTVTYLDEWDFKTDRVTEDITLYALWQELFKYAYVYGENNSQSRIISTNAEENAIATAPTVAPIWSGHTFLGFYADEECTQEFEFGRAYEFPVDTDGNKQYTYIIYTKWLDGVYKIVNTASDMQAIMTNANYYITADLDFTGIEVLMPISYAGTIEGNNHTISNLHMSYIRNDVTETSFGLFAKLEDATIKNLKFNNCSYELNVIKAGSFKIGFLAGEVGNSIIANVDVTNCKIRIISDNSGNKQWCLYEDGDPQITNVTETDNELVF